MSICREFKHYGFLVATICLFALTTNSAFAKDPLSGPIIAKPGQVIAGETISSADGPCIIIPENVTMVRIQNNKIGPCGTGVDGVGVRIDKGARHIYIAGNTIHDVSTGVYALKANHPIVMDRNMVYDVRGPLPMGQMVRFEDISGSGFKSRIFGNISDKYASKHPTAYEDHISIVKTFGTEKSPMLIACNKLRGGDYSTGSGITVGMDGGRWFRIRNNIIVLTSSTGIRIAGGERMRVSGNKIWNRGADKDSKTSKAFSVFSHNGERPMHLDINKNLAIANSWIGDDNGAVSEGLDDDGTARFITYASNNWKYALLKDTIWDTNIQDCQ